ncbi:response regulator [Geopseudomonas sagittaria]|uniref:response regulator n=1 Tax=Geopseudomonas sagittaria TaxID=1135990 RepID=UPI00111387C6|nr:response regulator [Pseudomonas sagittaria]
MLKEHLEERNRRLASLGQAVSQAGQDIGGAFDHLHVRAGSLDHADPLSLRHLQEEIVRLRQAALREPLQKVDAALQPVQQWAAQLHSDYGPHIESVRALGEMSRKVRRRILLVDDDDFMHKIVSLQLDDNEYELNVARDATKALRLLRSSVPDLVLLDIMMPGIDGLEALRRFRMMPSLARTPFIMLTGRSEGQVVVESLRVGANDFIAKPFDRATLLAKIGRFL